MNAVCDHDHLHSGLDGARLDRALSEAEARVVSAGERMTPPRRRVLSLLLESGAATHFAGARATRRSNRRRGGGALRGGETDIARHGMQSR